MANENHLSQLADMVVQAAKKKGLDFSEKSYCVICVTKDDTVLTVYRQPAVDISGLKPQPYFGNLFYPHRKYGRFKYIDVECAEIIYKKLSEVLNK